MIILTRLGESESKQEATLSIDFAISFHNEILKNKLFIHCQQLGIFHIVVNLATMTLVF